MTTSRGWPDSGTWDSTGPLSDTRCDGRAAALTLMSGGGADSGHVCVLKFGNRAEIWRARAKSLAVRPPAEWVLSVSVTLFHAIVTSG